MGTEYDRTENLTLIRPKNLSLAISAVLAAPAGAAMAQDQDQDAAGELVLEEVLVTARKRTESAMDIPSSIQAISAQTIKDAGLLSLDDYVRFIPSLSYVGTNPGSANIVFRGIGDAATNFIAESSAALYLDEQSLTLNATPDPRMVDIERVEALSGPQGTLYGASAQSGVLRVITNKPDPEAFDAFVDVMLRTGSDSDMSYDISGMVNIPISEQFAIRLVGFTAEDGGFIDNILGKTVRPRWRSDEGLFDNAASLRSNFNDVEHSGGRVSARWFLNDAWTVTAGIIHQDTLSHGRPERDPTQAQDLAVVRFKIDKEKDDLDWTQYALTFEGDLGFADFVSATSYFTRDWTYTQDTQSYAGYFSTFCYGYYVYTGPYCFQPEGTSYYYYNQPIGYLANVQKDTKFAQEFRLSSQGERFDYVAGLFYETHDQDWDFWTWTDGYAESQGRANYAAGRVTGDPRDIPSGDNWWYSADTTTFEQYAVFGEFTWHINDKWDALVGMRWFDRTIEKTYIVELPENNPDTFLELPADDNDVIPKFSVSYRATDDMMFYGLYSEGFRPSGTNRTRSTTAFFPRTYEADLLENIEFGTKMVLADGRVRLTASYFDMTWKNYQFELVDPSNIPCGTQGALPPPGCGQPWQKVVGNAGDAESTGFEIQLDAAATQNLKVGFAATWLDAKLTDGFIFGVVTPPGSRLPLSPEFKGSAYAQYDWDIDWFGGVFANAYARLQWSYTGSMLNQVEPYSLALTPDGSPGFSDPNYGPAPQIEMPSYNIGDLRVGFNGTSWGVQLFVNNLTDERAILFDNPFEFDHWSGKGRQTINRPREYGMRVTYNFGRR